MLLKFVVCQRIIDEGERIYLQLSSYHLYDVRMTVDFLEKWVSFEVFQLTVLVMLVLLRAKGDVLLQRQLFEVAHDQG